MSQKHFIDSHNGATFFFVLALIAIYGRWDNVTALVYLAMHGAYGFIWLLKSREFGDTQWEQPCGLGRGAVIWGALSMYWIAPWLICSRDIQAPAVWIGVCVFAYAFGVFYHFASDMQKTCWMRLNRGHLLTEGLWSKVRNPNYFGELLIYAGFSSLAMHPLPLLALALFVAFVWLPNMRRKDASLSRYPEFAAYRARSKLFIPGVF
jgi:protein-S-isoprenylcysteine O-methyltransferase Ste14